ncbi:MAG: hypothetical protein WD356_03100 [Pseudomonadales bacterium]
MDSEFEHIENEVVHARPGQYERRGDYEGPGNAYRIYRVRVNGAMLGVVKENGLRDLLVSIKGLDLYPDSCNLTHGQTFETDVRVHGEPLHVWVQVHVWKVLTGG